MGWGTVCAVTLAQFPARQYLAGKIRFFDPALYYNYPQFTKLIHFLGARLPCALARARPQAQTPACARSHCFRACVQPQNVAGQHFGTFGARGREPTNFGPRGTLLTIRVPGVSGELSLSSGRECGGRDVTRERKRVVMLAVWGASTPSEKEAVCVQRANERRHYTRSTHTTRR